MTLLADIRDFFRRERGWAFLFIFVIAVFAFLFLRPPRTVQKHRSQAMEELNRAEKKLKREIGATGGVQGFLSKRPQLLWTFSILSLVLAVSFLLGLVIDFIWVTRPGWRTKVQSTGPPEARSWGLGTIFKTILLFILAGVGLSVLLSFLKSFFFRGASGNLLVLIHTTVSDLFVIGIVIAFIRSRGGNWRDLGFWAVRPWKDFWTGVAGYAAILPVFALVLVALVAAVQVFGYEPPPHPLVEIFLEEEKRSQALIGYSIFLACMAGPVFEEIFFRGFCYPALKKRWGVAWALVLSSAFFSLIHQNLFAFFPVFILGLGLGYLYEKTGSLVPSIVLHIVHNTVFISYFFFAKQILERNL